jgi:replicative DNA helicase
VSVSTTSSPGAVSVPYSAQAEQSVVGHALADPTCIGEIVATLLEGRHFHNAAHRILYEAIIEAFFADDPVDPLTIAESCSKRLCRLLDTTEAEVVERVRSWALAARTTPGRASDHALVVKRHADLRALLDLSGAIRVAVEREEVPPDQIAGMASSEAMRIATNSVIAHELVQFGDVGRHFIHAMKERQALRQQGVQVGAHFSIGAIDAFTMGLQPTELMIGGGEPGVGKSAVFWKCAMNFAESQAKRALASGEKPVGTLVLSLEMGELPSSTRWAQSLTEIDSAQMRDGSLTQAELQKIIQKWGEKKNYPLWMNYASGLRLSQLRALISEGIRKHNVGLVVIDHFLLLDPDERGMTANENDDARVKFLKNQIAKDLNVAVICLAHTRKAIERADKRPRLADLRGAGTIAAFADFVGLMFRPWHYASEKDRDSGKVAATDAEMIWAKNRHGIDGTGNFYFDPARMMVI